MTNYFYVDKTTGTFTDELLTAGFIRLLENLFHRQGEVGFEIMQTDFGHYYQIQVTPALDMERLGVGIPSFPLAPILRTKKNSKTLPDLPDDPFYVVDYEAEKEKGAAFFAAYKELEGTLKRAYAIGDDDNFPFASMPLPPHDRWNVFTLLNAPPMPINGYNKLMTQWLAVGEAGEMGAVCRLLCDLFSQTPNDLDAADKTWKPLAKPYKWTEKASASQFFNPSQGKGINKALPNGAGLGNMKNFWLLEWLKAIGFYHMAFTGRVKGTDDRKTYVPAAGRSSFAARQAVQKQFRKKMRFGETAVRADILTIIRYVQSFIERVEAAQSETASETERVFLAMIEKVKRPSDFLRGFHAVYYKSLGTAAATMNISFLNLPGWVEIRQPEDVALFRDILEEQDRIVRQFAENKGEEIDLLQQFRDFIVADNLDPLFEFTTAYSSWLISQGEKPGFPPRKFTTDNLRRLIVSNQGNLSEILDSPGFINIAYAIRQSTVTAQYRKAQGDRRYNVRYGLGRDLVRQSQYPAEFIAALSDFLYKYNAENAQVLENRPGPYRRSIQTGDIKEITRLIDEHGSNVIAKLLVA
ncbi:MAG: hypothetical protein ACE5EY_07375, partial [Anaerolineae bacterium]